MTIDRILIIPFLFLLCFDLIGQKIQVVDVSGSALQGCTAYNATTSETYVSDQRGILHLQSLKDTDSLMFSLLGYETVRYSGKTLRDSLSYRVELNLISLLLDEFFISVSRWRQRNSDIPFRIQRINKSIIRDQNPQTSADLLGMNGEVLIQKSQQGGGSPMIRGFSANRLLYAVDGIRMNTAIFRSGNLQNIISIDPFIIENAEVLFGPGAVPYGSDAIGGVMAFQTLLPDHSEDHNFNLNARYSTANREKTIHFDGRYGEGRWTGLTSLSLTDYGDLKMGSHGPDEYLLNDYAVRKNDADTLLVNPDARIQQNTHFKQIHFNQKVQFVPNENSKWLASVYYSATTDFGRYDRLIRRRSNGLPNSAEWQYGPQKWLSAYLSFERKKQNAWYDQMKWILAYQRFEESRKDRDFNDAFRNIRAESVDAWSANGDLSKQITTLAALDFGVESVFNNVQSSGLTENIQTNAVQAASPRYPNSVWASNAAYATLSYKAGSAWRFHSGIRLNHIYMSSKFDTTLFSLPFDAAEIQNLGLSGGLGFTFKSKKNLFVSGNISTGFRAPNVDDAGKIFDSEPGKIVVPNPDLRPENAVNFEGSASKVFGNRFRVDMTLYYTVLFGGMVRRDAQFEGQDSIWYDGERAQVQSTLNAASIRTHGLQGGFEWNLPHRWNVYGRINFQYGVEELDEESLSPSRHAAPAFGMVRLSKNYEKLTAAITCFASAGYSFEQLPVTELSKAYLYAQDENGNPYSPAWYRLDCSFKYRLNDCVEFNAGIENILDARYRTYSSGLSAPGINGWLAASLAF